MNQRGSYPHNPTFNCIAVRHRREILRALSTWRPPLTEQRLSAYLAAADKNTTAVETSTISEMRLELTHVHLAKLESVGLIMWKQAEGTVELADHPAVSDPRFNQLLDLRMNSLDEVLSVLSHDYRRIILTLLEGERKPLSISQLVNQFRRRASDTPEIDIPRREALTALLYHTHLPKLDNIGFIDYTPERAEIFYVGHPTLEDVFSIIYEPDESVVEKLDGFLDGLGESYRQARHGTRDEIAWPHIWREPHHG